MIFIVFRSGSPKNKSMIPRNGPSCHVESGFSFSKFCHQGSEHLSQGFEAGNLTGRRLEHGVFGVVREKTLQVPLTETVQMVVENDFS